MAEPLLNAFREYSTELYDFSSAYKQVNIRMLLYINKTCIFYYWPMFLLLDNCFICSCSIFPPEIFT